MFIDEIEQANTVHNNMKTPYKPNLKRKSTDKLSTYHVRHFGWRQESVVMEGRLGDAESVGSWLCSFLRLHSACLCIQSAKTHHNNHTGTWDLYYFLSVFYILFLKFTF